MGLGYDQPLHILALDHRIPPHGGLFGVSGVPAAVATAKIVDAKFVIVDGFARALDDGAPPEGAGILVDEEFGAQPARDALARGWICAMPAERSGLRCFDFEYGDAFAGHIEAFDPTFTKILVRYNPDGDAADNERSRTNLRRLSAWLRESGRKLMCELIVPAEAGQLTSVDGDPDRFDAELRPALMRRGMAELQDAVVEPDVWKVEGIDRRDDCEMIAEQARSGGRDRVGCVVLGRGADPPRVEHWLRTAAGVPGYLGFAIGRTLWGNEIKGYRDSSLSRADAVGRIAANYRRAVAVYTGAA